MSNRRRHRTGRLTARPPQPPAHVVAAAYEQACPDCDSEISVIRDEQGLWHVGIAHDDGCVQLQWRQDHGALHGLLIAPEPGHTVPAELVADVVKAFGEATHADAVRVALDGNGATSWQERQVVDNLLNHEGGE